MADNSPTLSEMEDSLTHYGVKGMRWGVRRSASGSGGSGSSPKKVTLKVDPAKVKQVMPTAQMKTAAATSAKATKKALDYGALPLAATAAGLGFPTVALLGIAVKVLSDPSVHEAVKAGGQYAAGLLSQVGDSTLGELRK